METIINFPLKELYKAPSPKRAKRAVLRLRRILSKRFHVKEDDVYISQKINEAIWAKGFEKIPRYLEIKILKEENKLKALLKNEEIKAEEAKGGKEKGKKGGEKKETKGKGEEKAEEEKKKVERKGEERKKLEEKKEREKIAEHAKRK